MRQEPRPIIRNAVVTQVEVGQNLRLKDELRNLTRATIADLVVREVQLRDSLVQHQVLHQDFGQIIIDQVSRQSQVSERRGRPQALAEVLCVAHLHTEHGALVAHAYVLGTIRQLEEGQVGQEVKQVRNLEVLQLTDREGEDLVAHGIQIPKQLLSIFGLEIFEQILDVFLDVGLLVRITVLLLLDVLHARVAAALLLPVELLGDVPGRNGYWQVVVDLANDVVLNLRVLNAIQVWVLLEVFCHYGLRDLLQRLDLVRWEGSVTLLLGLHDGLGNVAVVEGFLFFSFLGLGLGHLARGSYFLSERHFYLINSNSL